MGPAGELDAMMSAARAAGDGLLLRFRDRGSLRVEMKGRADFVSTADLESQETLRARLLGACPTFGFLAEEGDAATEGGAREARFIVDPLDGTTNFAHGFPYFCVSLGVEHRPAGLAPDQDGELIAGVIYQPMHNELFVAEKGSGAYLNGRKLQVSKTAQLQEALLATGSPSHKRHENPNIHFYQQLTLRSHGVRRAGAAALDLAYTAAGRFDAYWEFNLNPWDSAAGALMVTEAGGKMTGFDGSPFKLESKEILATNGLLLPELQHIFEDMFAGRDIEPVPTPAEFAARRKAV